MQAVYQVDESPRYSRIGRWPHSASFSIWLSADAGRPLAWREWSVRDDFQVLLGTNHLTIGPTGWIQARFERADQIANKGQGGGGNDAAIETAPSEMGIMR